MRLRAPMRNILMVSEPGEYGVFDYVQNLTRHIWRAHPEVRVNFAYSSRRGSPALNTLVSEVIQRGGSVLDLDVGNAPGPADLGALRQLLKMVRTERPEVVHAHSSKAGALVRIAAALFNFPPVLYSPHAYYGLARKGGARELLYNTIEALLGRIGLTHCVSEDEAAFGKEVLRLPAQSLRVIHHGIDLHRFSPVTNAEEKRALRAKLGIPDVDAPLLVAVGRVSWQKNYEPLYAALSEVLPRGRWFFAHAGAGAPELAQGLSDEAAHRCRTFPYLENIEDLLKAADAFIQTSLYEAGVSLALLQAIACGLPAILTNAPGTRTVKAMNLETISWLSQTCERGTRREIVQTLAGWTCPDPSARARQRDLALALLSAEKQLEQVFRLLCTHTSR